MAGSSSQANPTNVRKRVEAETNSLKRASNGSAFARCEECRKDVPVVLIDMHSCSLEAKIKMNLEAQVVEKLTEVKKKPVERKKTKSTESNGNKSKKAGKGKDPNMPKRPLSSFMLFMEDFRKSFKEANPEGSKKASMVAKEGGVKWKSMSEEEKKPYLDRSAELKEEYEKAMENYNADNGDDEEASSDKEVEEVKTVEEVQEVSDDE